VDVSGGWYDAGDHGKYVAGGGFAAALVLQAYELTGDPALLDEALWQVDWLVRMQVPPGARHAGLAFHRIHDDNWTPLPMAPHDDPARRVLHRPSTTAALTLAAVAAQAARLTSRADLLHVARTAYEAARREPDLLAPDDQGAHGGGPYDDPDPSDDFSWAAAELWLATGEPAYRDAVDRRDAADFDWDDLPLWTAIRLDDAAAVTAAADGLLRLREPWGQKYAPEGGWHWGSTGRILHNLAVLGTAHRLTGTTAYRDGLLTGLDYLFGRNPVGLSYVTGWGTETSHNQRVRHFTHPPRGAIAGGPCSRPTPGFAVDPRFAGLPDQLHYVDEPTSETTNDVCIRWNAALVLVAALLRPESPLSSRVSTPEPGRDASQMPM
jgi:endoglucanase